MKYWGLASASGFFRVSQLEVQVVTVVGFASVAAIGPGLVSCLRLLSL
jgi:hypothetical protein